MEQLTDLILRDLLFDAVTKGRDAEVGYQAATALNHLVEELTLAGTEDALLFFELYKMVVGDRLEIDRRDYPRSDPCGLEEGKASPLDRVTPNTAPICPTEPMR